MSSLKTAGAAIAALVLCCSATAAHAARFTAVFNGLVTEGVDHQGLFGAAGVGLAGQAFTATYTFVTRPGDYQITSVREGFVGGDVVSTANPVTSVVFDIEGAFFQFTPDYYGEITRSATVGMDFQVAGQQGSGAFGGPPAVGLTMSLHSTSILPLDAPFSALSAGPSSANSVGRFVIGGFDSGGSPVFDMDVYFAVASVDVTAVPEPATWALMLLGFGVVGGLVRRRRLLAVGSTP